MSTTTAKPTPIKPTLNIDNIQGDVLQGLPKRYQSFVFFDIVHPTQFRQKLQSIIPLITTTTQAMHDNDAIDAHKAKGEKCLLKLVGTNIAFSQKGLDALGITDDLKDPLFLAGQLADASKNAQEGGLADPGVVTGPPTHPTTDPAWEPAFKQTIHGCFLITGESLTTTHERSAHLDHVLGGSVKKLFTVRGRVRRGAENGHEHFGFKDGLSQPQIDGFNTPNPGQLLTPPGVLLLGETGDTISGRPDWAKDSSFLVFRKLQQFVPEFNDFLALNPIPDKGLTPAQGSELLGARLIGRWKSGAPIDLDPIHDNPADAVPSRVNDFDYSDDPGQVKCPFSAHLRKTNPRAGFPGVDAVQLSRIMRQGIPFGPEVDEDEKDAALTLHERGLLFACYQSNITLGFHQLQQRWANSPTFPPPHGNGLDPIIGQSVNNPRSTSGTDPQNLTATLALPKQPFVVPLGGEYFLSPSISALKTKFAA
jgi:Dyp-type peroxidase family